MYPLPDLDEYTDDKHSNIPDFKCQCDFTAAKELNITLQCIDKQKGIFAGTVYILLKFSTVYMSIIYD